MRGREREIRESGGEWKRFDVQRIVPLRVLSLSLSRFAPYFGFSSLIWTDLNFFGPRPTPKS